MNVTAAAWRELQTLLGIILLALLIYWLFRARRRNPSVFGLLLLSILAYLPVSGIFSLNATVAEHWIYLSSAFLFLAAATQCTEFFTSRGATIRAAILVVFALWLVFLGVRTFLRTFDWKDQHTFAERTIASGGNSARMLINLAGIELSEGKLTDAAVLLHEALHKSPEEPLALINLASVALKENDFKTARELLNRATQMPLVEAQAHECLAVLENKESGKVDLTRMRLAARTDPPNWSIEKRYIELLDETGSTSAAINELLTCLRTQWYRADSWKLLSELETKAGRLDQSANALAQARAYDVHLTTSK